MSPCKECGHKAGLHDAACQSAPSPQPEIRIEIDPCYGDGAYWVSVSALHKALATQGLTIVGPAERAVLDASLAFPEHTLGSTATIIGLPRKQLSDLCWCWEQAVLRLHEARRNTK